MSIDVTKIYTLEEILALGDIEDKISLLQWRKTPLPDVSKLSAAWDFNKHDVMDTTVRPDFDVIVQDEKTNADGEVVEKEIKKEQKVNRIVMALEQNIINVQTAFTMSIEPKLQCVPEGADEEDLLQAIFLVNRRNKMVHMNKDVVRAWLSEQEVAEFWYVSDEEGYWGKLAGKGKGVAPRYGLRSMLWSPLRGDTLYPFFDQYGNLLAMSRSYEVSYPNNITRTQFMTVTPSTVYVWEEDQGWTLISQSTHGFDKLPVIYAYREQQFCAGIQTIRNRIETLLSNFADAMDYNFFPYLVLEGDIQGAMQPAGRSRVMQMENGGKAEYLQWDQSAEMIRLEVENLMKQCYTMTNTPQLSFSDLKGLGNVLSGVSFRYAFAGTHFEVDMHARTIEEFLQRRYNFLIHAIGRLWARFAQASLTLEITPKIVPYIIDDTAAKVDTATKGVGGGIMSKQTAIEHIGVVEDVNDEMLRIAQDASEEAENEEAEEVEVEDEDTASGGSPVI
jgi:hypothetical protein